MRGRKRRVNKNKSGGGTEKEGKREEEFRGGGKRGI